MKRNRTPWRQSRLWIWVRRFIDQSRISWCITKQRGHKNGGGAKGKKKWFGSCQKDIAIWRACPYQNETIWASKWMTVNLFNTLNVLICMFIMILKKKFQRVGCPTRQLTWFLQSQHQWREKRRGSTLDKSPES